MPATDSRHAAPAVVVAPEPGGRGHDPAQAGRVERQHDGIRREPVLVVVAGQAVQHRDAVAELGDRAHLAPGDHRDPEAVQVRTERAPERRVVVVARHVEEQPLGRAEEVAGGTSRPARRRRTRAGRRRSCGRTPPAPGAAPPPGTAAGRAPRRRCCPSRAAKVAGKSTSSSPRAASTSTAARPARSKLGLRATNAARFSGGVRGMLDEGVAPPAVTHERVVVERAQPVQGRVGAAQQRAQVVVLPEERVEAAAHLAALAVGQRDRPRPHPPAEPVPALEHGDPHPALGQAQRRGESRDAAAHDDDVPRGCRRARGIRRWPAGAGGGWNTARRSRPGVQRRGAADHDGADPATVCTIPCCHPGTERCLTSTRPADSSRSQTRSTESKSRTLRRGSGAAARRSASARPAG